MIALTLALLLPVVNGYALTSLLWRSSRLTLSQAFIKLCLAIGVGFGSFSCLFYLWLLVFGPSKTGLFEAQAGLFAVLAVILIYRRRGRGPGRSTEPPATAIIRSRLERVLALAFVLMLGAGALNLVVLALSKPHGDWDAWAIWNVRARFIFRAGPLWRDAFSYVMDRSRPDYPVLMPSTVAGLWTLIGDDTVLIPALLAILFALATVGLTVSSLAVLRGRSEACLAGLTLLGTPLFITHSASQYVDVPLGFFVLATLVLVALYDDAGGQARGIMVLAGVAAGLTGWMKNEGLLFVLAVMAARSAVIIPADGLRAWAREMGRFAAGLAPIAVIIIHFKSTLAPPSYLVALQESRDIYVKLFDFSRYRVVWASIGEQVWTFGGWVVSLPMILAFYVLLVGIQASRRTTLSIVTSTITLSLMLLGESLIYIITPIDLKYAVDLSLGRLFLQLWPVFIFTYFLLVQPVGPIVRPERRPAAAGREAVDAVGDGR